MLLALDLLPSLGTAPVRADTVVGGWLLSLVLGMLQRILPFLAAIHAARAGRRIPKVSDLSTGPFLGIQTAAHVMALVTVGTGMVLGLDWLIRVGALTGAAGAGAFIIYALGIYVRIRALPPARTAASKEKTSP